MMKCASVLDAQIFHTSPAKAVALKMIQKMIWVVIWRKKTCRIAGMDLLGEMGVGVYVPSIALARGGAGGAIFDDKAKNIRDKMRYSNLSNNMMISKL